MDRSGAGETRPETFDVGGVALARPSGGEGRTGGISSTNRALAAFYRDVMGLCDGGVAERHRCLFLRATPNTFAALYPKALRASWD